jgi:hypothetical protein
MEHSGQGKQPAARRLIQNVRQFFGGSDPTAAIGEKLNTRLTNNVITFLSVKGNNFGEPLFICGQRFQTRNIIVTHGIELVLENGGKIAVTLQFVLHHLDKFFYSLRHCF